jgi:hypothetical protein
MTATQGTNDAERRTFGVVVFLLVENARLIPIPPVAWGFAGRKNWFSLFLPPALP